MDPGSIVAARSQREGVPAAGPRGAGGEGSLIAHRAGSPSRASSPAGFACASASSSRLHAKYAEPNGRPRCGTAPHPADNGRFCTIRTCPRQLKFPAHFATSTLSSPRLYRRKSAKPLIHTQIFIARSGAAFLKDRAILLRSLALRRVEAALMSIFSETPGAPCWSACWPVSQVRDVPIHLAEKMANATMRSRPAPIIYVAAVFFGLAFRAILAFRCNLPEIMPPPCSSQTPRRRISPGPAASHANHLAISRVDRPRYTGPRACPNKGLRDAPQTTAPARAHGTRRLFTPGRPPP